MTTERYVVKLASGELMTRAGVAVQGQVDGTKMSRAEAYQLAWLHGAVALRLKPSKRAAELAKLRAEVAELRGRCTGYQDAADEGRAELAKLRAEVEALKVDLADASEVRDRKWAEAKHATSQLHAMTAERDHERRTANEAVAQLHDVTRERDTLRDQLGAVEAQLRGAREHRIRAEGERDALTAQLAALPPDVTDEELVNALFNEWAKPMGSGHKGWLSVAALARRLLRGPVAPARPVDALRDELLDAWLRGDKDNPMGSVAKRARELGAR